MAAAASQDRPAPSHLLRTDASTLTRAGRAGRTVRAGWAVAWPKVRGPVTIGLAIAFLVGAIVFTLATS